jgi:hypothetical protein
VGRVLTALIGAVGVAFRTLDLDDIGTKIREHHSGARAGYESALLDHPDTCECAVHEVAPLKHPRWA